MKSIAQISSLGRAIRTKRAAISAAATRPSVTVELDESTSTATVTGPLPASKNAILCGLPFSSTVKSRASSPSRLFPCLSCTCLSCTCTLTVCRLASDRMTGTSGWGGDERCPDGPQKALWGEAATMTEMLNEIATSAHWKGRNIGSSCRN